MTAFIPLYRLALLRASFVAQQLGSHLREGPAIAIEGCPSLRVRPPPLDDDIDIGRADLHREDRFLKAALRPMSGLSAICQFDRPHIVQSR